MHLESVSASLADGGIVLSRKRTAGAGSGRSGSADYRRRQEPVVLARSASARGRTPPAAGLAQLDGTARLFAHQLRQCRQQLAALAGIAPVRLLPAEMVAPRSCCDPDLTRCTVAVSHTAACRGNTHLPRAPHPLTPPTLPPHPL